MWISIAYSKISGLVYFLDKEFDMKSPILFSFKGNNPKMFQIQRPQKFVPEKGLNNAAKGSFSDISLFFLTTIRLILNNAKQIFHSRLHIMLYILLKMVELESMGFGTFVEYLAGIKFFHKLLENKVRKQSGSLDTFKLFKT